MTNHTHGKELRAQLGKAEAEMKENQAAFNAYRQADARVRAAKKKGEAPELRHENAKAKHRKGHNAYMRAYTRRKGLLKQRGA